MRDLNQKQKAAIYDGQKLVEKFNSQFSVGDKVKIRKIAKKSFPQTEVTVRAAAFMANGDTPVAFFEEISGSFSIEPGFIEYK